MVGCSLSLSLSLFRPFSCYYPLRCFPRVLHCVCHSLSALLPHCRCLFSSSLSVYFSCETCCHRNPSWMTILSCVVLFIFLSLVSSTASFYSVWFFTSALLSTTDRQRTMPCTCPTMSERSSFSKVYPGHTCKTEAFQHDAKKLYKRKIKHDVHTSLGKKHVCGEKKTKKKRMRTAERPC